MYFGRVCHYGSNTIRKKWTNQSVDHEAAKKYMLVTAYSEGHGEVATKKNYIALSGRKKADIDRRLMHVEIQPVEWPTDAEFDGMEPKYFRLVDGEVTVHS